MGNLLHRAWTAVRHGFSLAIRGLASLRTSILGSLLTAFVAVVLPLYIAAFGLYSWGIGQVKAQVLGDSASRITALLDGIDAELSRVRSQQTSLLQDRDVMRLALMGATMDPIEQTLQINRVQSRLLSVQDGSSLIADASLYMPGIGKTLHSAQSYTPLTEEEYGAVCELAGRGGMVWREESPLLMLPYPNNTLRTPAYLAEARLSIPALTRALDAMSLQGAALLDVSAGRVLASAGSVDAGESDPMGLTPGAVNTAESAAHWTISLRSADSGLALVGWVDRQSVNAPLRRYQPYFWLLTLGAVVLAAAFIGIVDRLAHRPLLHLVEAFESVEHGDLTVAIAHSKNDEFRSLYAGFNRMLSRLRQLIDQVYTQKIIAQQMELKQLQSQINPHFLYNSFFALQNMADGGDSENLSEYCRLLGRYFQYVTRNAGDTATLAEEAEHALNYGLIQARRYRSRMSLSFAPPPPSLARERVPRLILQPILENAFEHGLREKLDTGLIRVDFLDDGPAFRIIVEDNGCADPVAIDRMRTALKGEGENTGMINVHHRLRLTFGEGSGLTLSPGMDGGLRVTLTIVRREEMP